MTRPWMVTAGVLLVLTPTATLAQYAPNPASSPARPTYPQQPYQATAPNHSPNSGNSGVQQPYPPTIERVQPSQGATAQAAAPRQQAVGAPFVLSPQEESLLNQVLAAWERTSKNVKRFECEFHRFHYDGVFDNGRSPKIHQGEIKFAEPDKGMLKIVGEVIGGKLEKSSDGEHWVCDGKALYEYKPTTKTLEVYELPPEERGKAITESPLPFLFGAEAERLKQRYFLRVITPPEAQGQVWLEAYPKYQKDAANFIRAEVILTTANMQLYALKLYQPNGKNADAYRFMNMKVNPSNFLDFFRDDPFEPRTPFGWKRVVKPAATTPRAAMQPAGNAAR